MNVTSRMHASQSRFTREKRVFCSALLLASLGATRQAAALEWAGRSWNVTSGGMAGVCQGNPANVSVDANGYLHLKITKNGSTWSAAEIFSADKLGFGTYQWQVDGPIDHFDPNVVLGLYPYGPAAGIGKDGTNEIDIEYSRWGHADGPNGDWTDYPASGTVIGEKTYTFSLSGGTLSTSRFIWSASSIQSSLIKGLQPVGSNTDLINSWTYQPSNPQTNIPQQALPLGMNLWCFDTTPTDGMPVEVVIRDFKFVAEGTDPGGTGGAGGSGGSAGGANHGGTGGMGSATGGTGGMNHGGATGTAGKGGTSGGSAGTGAGSAGAGGTGNSSSAGAAGASAAAAGSAGNDSAAGTGASGAPMTGTGGSFTGSSGGGAATSSAGSSPAASAGSSAAADGNDQSSSCSLSAVGVRRGWGLLGLLPLLVLARRARRRAHG